MQAITTIGLDVAKSVSQGSGASASRAIAIYVDCSQRVHSQSFAMPRSTVSDTDRGSPHC